jgi:cytochrome c-type biogenesis protein CcmE
MPTKTTRAILSVLIVGAALSTLLFTTMRGSADYFKHVDEVVPHAADWYGKSLQLHGFVVDGSIGKRPNTLDYQFKVQHGDSVVLTSYTGVVPDTFKDGAEVVMKGRLQKDGFHAETITAKCPSKYDPDQQGQAR